MTSIVAQSRYTEDFAVAGMRRLRRAEFKPIRFWGGFILLVIAGATMIVGSWRSTKPDWSGPIIVAGMVVYVLLAPNFAERRLRKEHRKSTDPDKLITWTFSEEGLQSNSATGSGVDQWRAYVKARSFSDGLLIYPLKRVGIWVPRNAFQSEEDFAAASQLVAAKISDFKAISPSNLRDWASRLMR